MKHRIVALLQGLDGPGGIQRNSRSLARVLSDYAAAHDFDLAVLSFADRDGWHDSRYLAEPIQGCNGSRAQFVARAARLLANPHSLVIVGQVDFAPLVFVSHLLLPNVPVVVMTYGIEVWRPLPAHKRAGLHIADRVVAISAYTAGKLQSEQGLDAHRLRVIPCTLDDHFSDAIMAWHVSRQPCVPSRLLTIARMNKRDADKGIEHVLAALPAVRQQVVDVNYTIVGDGDDRLRLEQAARSLNVADIVQFVGRVPDEQLHAYLSGTDVFVMPSRKEGFGIVFLEAMAYGKAVIAGAHGGSPEVVVDGETGLLVRYGHHDALADAIVHLLGDPARRERMGAAGLRRVQNVFSYARFSDSFCQLLEECLEPHGEVIR